MLERTGGPRLPFAARPGIGLTSPSAFRVEAPSAAPSRSDHVPSDGEGRRLAPGDRLVYAWFPESGLADPTAPGPGGVPGPDSASGGVYAATAFALDIDFADGGHLSDNPARDQYGTAVTPSAQAEARQLYVDQWNLRTVDLSEHAGREIVRIRAVVAPSPDRPVTGWLDAVEVAPAPSVPERPVDLADTRRGTHSSGRFSRGNTAPLVAVPHGGVYGLPMTDADSSRWPYAYHEHHGSDARPAIQAFATSHIPSPWVGDRGVFQVMPSPDAEPDTTRSGRARAFDRADEHAHPHRYEVALDGGMHVELTAAEHALALRMRWSGPEASLVLDHHGVVVDPEVRIADGIATVDLVLHDREDTPAHHIHLRVDHAVADRTRLSGTASGMRLGGHLVLDPGPGADVEVLIGVSTIGRDEARAHALGTGGFASALRAADAAWTAALGVLELDGASEDRARSVYGSLARLLLYPGEHSEPDADGRRRYRNPFADLRVPVPGEAPEPVRAGAFAMNHGFWDTYRTCWPAFSLLEPDRAGALGEGFIEHFRAGGWTSRWSAPGPLDAMTGTSTDTVFADLALRGADGFDTATAYLSALKNATVPSTAADTRVGRNGLREAIFRGFVSTATGEGLSWSLDNAINDWAAAQLALRLASEAADPAARERLRTESDYLARRSLRYRELFHPELGFFVGRDDDGGWRASTDSYDPDLWGSDYTETNGWGTAFTAPHDGAGLAALHGGAEGLGRALDRFFARPETGEVRVAGSYGQVIHEMTEARDVRMGMLGLSNQPAHHIPFMYSFAGRHDDAHRRVVEARTRLFVGSDLGQGYPGDEDNGEMSAWYLFAVLGLYPLVPSSATYVLLPPMLPRVVLRARGRGPLEIVARGAGAPFIREVRVDGEPWRSISIPHERVVAARRIEFDLSDAPSGWASDTVPPSASDLRSIREPLRDAAIRADGVPEAALLVDDRGDAPVSVRRGDRIEVDLAAPTRPGLYAITADEPGDASWTIEWIGDDGTVLAVDERRDERFAWPRQTRPFTPAATDAGPARRVRVVAGGDLRISQLEFFAD